MKFFLSFTPTTKASLKELKESPHLAKRFKAVSKALKLLQENPRHPGLQTHEFYSFKGSHGEKVFEAYAEQDTPAAYRIFFFYGGRRGEMVIVAITSHP
ncbi:MAG: hypothetical protein Q8Q87_01070 [Candidatus Omnitrophota bacterium]|nr:hypothetical protein [Candidatus Omnitrophota bacterium]